MDADDGVTTLREALMAAETNTAQSSVDDMGTPDDPTDDVTTETVAAGEEDGDSITFAEGVTEILSASTPPCRT